MWHLSSVQETLALQQTSCCITKCSKNCHRLYLFKYHPPANIPNQAWFEPRWNISASSFSSSSPQVSHRPLLLCRRGSGRSCFQSPRQQSHWRVICWWASSALRGLTIYLCVCVCANKFSSSNSMHQQTNPPGDLPFMASVKLNKSTWCFFITPPSLRLYCPVTLTLTLHPRTAAEAYL